MNTSLQYWIWRQETFSVFNPVSFEILAVVTRFTKMRKDLWGQGNLAGDITDFFQSKYLMRASIVLGAWETKVEKILLKHLKVLVGWVCWMWLIPAGKSWLLDPGLSHVGSQYLGSLRSAMIVVFIPQKLANATHWCSPSFIRLLSIYLHSTVGADKWLEGCSTSNSASIVRISSKEISNAYPEAILQGVTTGSWAGWGRGNFAALKTGRALVAANRPEGPFAAGAQKGLFSGRSWPSLAKAKQKVLFTSWSSSWSQANFLQYYFLFERSICPSLQLLLYIFWLSLYAEKSLELFEEKVKC